MEYAFETIEATWQAYWAKEKTFKALDTSSQPKYYVLDMLPYPSGSGLHIGHPEGYTATDILARTYKAKGYNVLHPMGWDAFGLPAEQHALATGVHPAVNTDQNIAVFKCQLQRLGFALDWDREISSTDPSFYRWTQWIFLQLFKKGLAYVDEQPVWWCEALGTALANEEVIDGRSERGNHPVERRKLRQWVLRITAYAEKLLLGLEGLDWPDSTKRQQIAWIGRSEGADVVFETDAGTTISVFTTRLDTLYGVSYIALAPEHPHAKAVTTPAQKAAVEAYIRQAAAKSDLLRSQLEKDKTGVFTGTYAINPINQERLPIWVADYVLPSYGTGAVMGVPAHDERDRAFAQKYGLAILEVIQPLGPSEPLELLEPFDTAKTKEACLMASGPYNGLNLEAAKKQILHDLSAQGKATPKVQYKLRDWLFSRQRYWGEPFPIVWVGQSAYEAAKAHSDSPFQEFLPPEPVTYTDADGVLWYALPLPASALPLLLPEVKAYKPASTGASPLAHATEWVEVYVHIKTGAVISRSQLQGQNLGEDWFEGQRETNTMPQWAGSCWYYLRYLDPKNEKALIDPPLEAYWKGPDIYIGGAEHAVLHLLYARFWHKVLYELGVVSTAEPFQRLVHQGLILGELEFTLYKTQAGKPLSFEWVSAAHTDTRTGEAVQGYTLTKEEAIKAGDHFVLKEDPSIRLEARSYKMSKSRGNVVSPDAVIKQYGADALRLYEMFLGPLEASKPWSTQGIEGMSRFLKKTWRTYVAEDGTLRPKLKEGPEDLEIQKLTQATIKKVSDDIEHLRFNTAISQLMICINALAKQSSLARKTLEAYLQLLAPFAPHIAEELWSRLGNKPSISNAPWPIYEPALLVEEKLKLIIQVNGKMRAEVYVDAKAKPEEVIAIARAHPKVAAALAGKVLKKEIYVPGKILNLVVD